MSNLVFPIEFSFQDQLITAFVKVKSIGYDLRFSIRYQNDFLRALLPGGVAVFSLANGIVSPGMINETVESLIVETTEALLLI